MRVLYYSQGGKYQMLSTVIANLSTIAKGWYSVGQDRASGLVNAEGRQRALHYRSAWRRAFTTALHETSNGVLARLSGFALGYPLASLGPRKLGGYGGSFLQATSCGRI